VAYWLEWWRYVGIGFSLNNGFGGRNDLRCGGHRSQSPRQDAVDDSVGVFGGDRTMVLQAFFEPCVCNRMAVQLCHGEDIITTATTLQSINDPAIVGVGRW